MSRKISDLHPQLIQLCEEFVREANKFLAKEIGPGTEAVVTHTLRTWEEQDELYSIGRRNIKDERIVTKAKGGYSWHNFGRAFDIAIRVDGKLSWDDSLPWKELGNIGKEIGLEWGGDWVGLNDLAHFQFRDGYSLADARRFYYQEKADKAREELRKILEETSMDFEIRGPKLPEFLIGKSKKTIRDPHCAPKISTKPLLSTEYGIRSIKTKNE